MMTTNRVPALAYSPPEPVQPTGTTAFRRLALGQDWQRAQVQTVRWRLFQTAGRIVRHGRQVFLKINAALLEMFTAIREHRACFLREESAVPETS